MSRTHSTRANQPNPEAPPRYQSGQTLGGYVMVRKLGEGGMGEVYLAEQTSLKRYVALKLLRPELTRNASALARFRAEAEAVAKINHANIVHVHELGEADGVLYMAMEYVDGFSLKDYLVRKGPPDLPVCLSLMRQVGSALQRAGELGIIHRDIKPENILLTKKGEAKVADFGLARCLEGDAPPLDLTRHGTTVGTPLYMSPEQVEGKPLDQRTDIYSFGVTCYIMLTGVPPFRGSTAFELALAHVKQPPRPLWEVRPDLPQELCNIVHKMMAKKRGDRYQTARDYLSDLARFRAGPTATSLSRQQAITANPDDFPAVLPADEPEPEPDESGNWWGRYRLQFVGAALAVLLGGLVGVGALVWYLRSKGEAPQATADQKEHEPAPPDKPPAVKTREQLLREEAERRLLAPDAAGLVACADLGLFYLEENRLDDAQALFVRLEAVKTPRSYFQLGRLGHGIVLAQRPQKAAESNQCFKDVFAPFPGLVGPYSSRGPRFPPLGKRPDWTASRQARQLNDELAPIRKQLDDQQWRQRLEKARWANTFNRVPDSQVPTYLLVHFPRRFGRK